MSKSEEKSTKDLEDLLGRFKFLKALSSDPQSKSAAILGQIDEKPGIITLEKTHFMITENDIHPENDINKPAFDVTELIVNLKLINQNDIYYWALGSVNQDLIHKPSLKINLIWPATDTHIKKYETQNYHLITETPKMYEEVVKPYIQSMRGDRIKWVENILHHGAEADKIIYHDLDEKNGFVLLPDMKWDGTNMETLYLVALVYTDEISSLRDIKPKHKEWLKNILVKLRKVVPCVYNHKVGSDELRIFIHYQPSYYHFHIHIANIKHRGLGDGISAGKAILLEDVIEQLDFLSEEGFAARNITYVIGESHGLWEGGLKELHQRDLKEAGFDL